MRCGVALPLLLALRLASSKRVLLHSATEHAEAVAGFLELAASAQLAIPASLSSALDSLDPKLIDSMKDKLKDSLSNSSFAGGIFQDPETVEFAITAAIQAANLTVGLVSELTKHVISELQSAREEITKWSSKLMEYGDVQIENFTLMVARATIQVNQADGRARAMYQSVHDIVELMVADLEEVLFSDDNDKDKKLSAISDARDAMSVALEGALEELARLIPIMVKAGEEFGEIGALSGHYELKIKDNVNNKDGWLDAKKAELRGIVYGSCVASVLLGPALILCYAIAAPILETKLSTLTEELKETKMAMTSIANRFGTLKTMSAGMGKAVKVSHDDMVAVDLKLKKTKQLVDREPKVDFWKAYVVGDLRKLVAVLEEKIGRKKDV